MKTCCTSVLLILMFSLCNQISFCQNILIKGISSLPDSGCIPFKIAPTLLLDSNIKVKKYEWNFGDGGASTDEKPLHTYIHEGIFAIKVYIETEDGYSETFKIDSAAFIGHKPKAQFKPFFDTICPHAKIEFTNTSVGGLITNLQWNFASVQNFDSGNTYFYDPTDTGYLPITLVAFDYGCSDTLKRNALYSIPPFASFLVTQNCDNKTFVEFKDRSILDIEHRYDFGDGVTDTTKNTSHNYKSPGDYTVVLYTHNNTCRDTAYKRIHIIDEIGSLVLSKNTFCAKDSALVYIFGVNENNILKTQWNFGDGTTQITNRNTKTYHIYFNPGRFQLSAIMTDLNNCTYSYEISPIDILPLPKIKIIGDNEGCANTIINFKAQNLNADNLQWHWSFDNGLTDTAKDVNTVFESGGFYNIVLTAYNKEGCISNSYNKIQINKPKVNAGNDTSICENSMLQLQATGAEDYLWQGEGLSCYNCQSPVITGDTVKSYFVTGRDVHGCTGRDSIQIAVIKPVKLKVFNHDTLCVGNKTQFLASGAYAYKWSPSSFLDNANLAQPVFSALKDTSINYQVIGYSKSNCFKDTNYLHIKVFPIPQMKIQQNEVELSAGSSIQLQPNSSKDITHWQWQPIVGLNNAFIANPIASPKQTTTYSVIGSNDGNCVARDEVTIKVICKNTNIFIPNTFSPNSDGMNDVFYPRGTGLSYIKSFRIFNRLGQEVFARYNIAPNNSEYGWNGKYDNEKLNSDVYVYIVEVVCENGSIIPIKGNITLLN